MVDPIGLPRAIDDENGVDRGIHDHGSDSKKTCLIHLLTDYPTDPALFVNVAFTPSLLRAMVEAVPCPLDFIEIREMSEFFSKTGKPL